MQQPLPFSHDANLDLHWDWTAWLDTASISSAVITPPPGVSISNQTTVGGVVTAWPSLSRKLQVGTLLPIECHVITSEIPPRADTRTITLVVAAR